MNGVTVNLAASHDVPGLFDSQVLFKGSPSTNVENGFIFIRQRVNLYRFDGDKWWGVEKGKKFSYKCQPWTDAEWRNYLFVFRFICEHYWNVQHPVWLEPPEDFKALDVPFVRPTHRPNFQSVYEMDVRDFKRNPHHHPHMAVIVMRQKDGEEDFRSYVSWSTAQAVLTNRDIKETNNVHQWGPFVLDEHVQVAAIHENLHMLGDEHVGKRKGYPQCKKGANGEICYGHNPADRSELAGMGLRWVRAYDRAWKERIALHTDTDSDDWTGHTRLFAPEPL